jgi:hypothetical protein
MTSTTITTTINGTYTVTTLNLLITSAGTINSTANAFALLDSGSIGILTNDGLIDGRGGNGGGISVAGSIGTLSNNGTITAGSSGSAVVAGSIGTLTNQGIISASSNGISDSGTLSSLDNEAGATISSNFGTALSADSIGTLANQGTISSNNGNGIDANHLTSLDNASGAVIQGQSAILVSGSIGNLTNEGHISAGAGRVAIQASSIGTLTNAGTIGGGNTGIKVYGSIGTLTNEGSVHGNSFGIFVTGTANIENAGTIGGSTEAIQFYGANSTLTLDSTSVINGNVSDGVNDGTLVLGGSSANTVTGIGSKYTGFKTITFNNANATAEGSTSGLAGTQTITGFTTGDSIKLDNFAAVSETYAAGTGLILTDANSNTKTLHISGNYTGTNFAFSSDGTNTTITDPTITISTSITTQVVVGAADNLVVTSSGTISTSGTAVAASASIGTISNGGSIASTAYAIYDAGNLASLDNAASGVIGGDGGNGIYVLGSIGTLTNEGGIVVSRGENAIQAGSIGSLTNTGTIGGGRLGIADSGSLTSMNNAAAGVINTSGTAIEVNGTLGTLTNEGLIHGGGRGIVVNTANIENAGTITAASLAIQFTGANSTLTIDPTSVISGIVLDQNSGGTLVLGGSTANTITGIGSQYIGFATISFNNANATAEGNTSGLANSQTITGMVAGDTIKLDSFAAVSETYIAGTGLILTDADSNTETLEILGSGYTTQDFQLSNDGTNTTITDVEPLCFLPGTLILTPTGEIPVEDLRVGDSVTTLDGKSRPIRWIGHGRLLAPAGRRSPATPVLIRRSALADNVPHRDLYVTKGHALYLNGVLIPAEFLVNHRSILWDDRGQEVRFYHIELDGHEILRANGAPAESYRDEANRWMFANANPAWDQPGVAPFAPVLTGGPRVDEVWRHMVDRSGINLNPPTTNDPDLHLLIDGVRVDGCHLTHNIISFAIPAHASRIVIASRAAAPDMLGTFRDPRRLGVAISRIVIWQDAAPLIIDADDEALTHGFHNYEPAEGCRWTNGHGLLPPMSLPHASKPRELHLTIRHTARYEHPADFAEEPKRLRAAA